jgi:signal transduction histidine kinase
MTDQNAALAGESRTLSRPYRAARPALSSGQPRIVRLGNDKVIATARVIVALLSLLALWLDPTTPAAREKLALAIFLAYSLGAGFVLFINLRDQLQITEPVRLGLHVLDLVFISLVVYFTAGTTRAFFGFFVFLMLVAHMRWQWRGTFWTAIAVLSAYVAIRGVAPAPALGHTTADDFIVRLSYIVVVAGVLIYLGYAQEAASRRMLLAAEWPSMMAPERALSAYLEHTARVLGPGNLLLIWFPEGEPLADLVFWESGQVRIKKRERDLIERWFDRDAADAQVFHWNARSRKTTIVAKGRRRVAVGRPPFPARLLRAGGAGAVFGITFAARGGHGCLLARHDVFGTDEIILAEIIASRFRAWADEMELVRERDEARARQQRFELMGELHDNVLQTLAGASLQLQSLRRRIAPADPDAADRVDQLVTALAGEQSELRQRLQQLAPEPTSPETKHNLGERLGQLAEAIERRWRLAADWELEPPDAMVDAFAEHQLSHLVLEAAANAKRHSHATRLAIRLTVQASDILLSIRNDRPEPPAGAAPAFEPRMLRARLDHLGGTLRVRREPDQVVLDMAFPTA